ncbi:MULTISPECIES: aromatic-ring hydroxylase C-terminal domain-containing protein [Nocardiaceae]|uniref:aromatic-ring hydroxylase C-terminal domain-containing protein n=1 Tax=Nocardiaceae TaxID=85025 RepID=UPI002E275B58
MRRDRGRAVHEGTACRLIARVRRGQVGESDCTRTDIVRRTDSGPAVLVRPDGYIAWAGRSESEEWLQILERWTDQPCSNVNECSRIRMDGPPASYA